jgi:TM2 domain-containing membrane protein YozV
MWYYQQGNNRIGPVDEAMIRNLLVSQTLNVNSLVWKEGMPAWLPVNQTSLVNGLVLPPPPLPGSSSAAPKDRVIYVILAIFLGSLGIHNFFAGYKRNAIIQLIITLATCFIASFVTWIWAVIEACTVTKDADGVDFK